MENHKKQVIALTRPKNQTQEWQKTLESAGFGVFLCPLLKIVPLSSELQNSVAQNLRNFLTQPSAVIFISPNAARFALKIESAKFWNQHCLFAVGSGTQNVLKEKGLNALIPKDSEDSEGLLKCIESQNLPFHTIAIIRGDHGRDFLGNALKNKGFNVVYFGVYRRETCDVLMAQNLLNQALTGKITGMVITSSQALSAWLTLLKLPRLPAALVKFPVFVIHPRIAQKAQHLGFKNVVEVKNSKTLVDFLTRKGHPNG